METLEGNLLVMRRSGNNEAAKAAAAAIEALREPSDVLAGWLLDRLSTEAVDPKVLARCIGARPGKTGLLSTPLRNSEVHQIASRYVRVVKARAAQACETRRC